jgi:putative PIN family toxin of toxin-antitoxin system
MASLLRAVLDTNVLLAAARSPHKTSPTAEILDRWQRREFTFLVSLDTLSEYAEKLLSLGVSSHDAESFITNLAIHAELVSVAFFHVRHYPVDPDDVMFLLCAINGHASHLVSYDNHLIALRPLYKKELKICEPIEFLEDCRTDDAE